MQDIQATLTADLQKQGIDFHSLSPEQKHATLNKFLETHYEHDKALLSDNVKR
jgi:lambda repressor-like predicted transcriptional regulator